MGVPGFFAWLLKNFKKNKIIQENIETNNKKYLYIDANCLIHPQSFKILDNCIDIKDVNKLEDYMIKRIIKYINYIVNTVKDVKKVFIGVDGVAPLAKISQQRKRRYKSVYENKIKNELKDKYKIKYNNSWSNVKISPGTVFMEKLHKEIEKEVIKKNTLNKEIEYIYSSYFEEGEGENKILKHIKKNLDEIKKEKIDVIIYGLDADLFFLSMTVMSENKDIQMYLLRESSFMNSKKEEIKEELYDIVDDVAEDLIYVSINETIKSYEELIKGMIIKAKRGNIEYYYKKNNKELTEEIINKNMERFNKKVSELNIISDFVFICYLLGNDFISKIESIDIKKNGLDFLIDCYIEVYIKTETNIVYKEDNETKINYIVLEEILRICSIKEEYYFKNILPKYKEIHKNRKSQETDLYKKELYDLENLKNIKIEDKIKLGEGEPEEWKLRYYNHYLKRDDKTLNLDEINKMCYNYLEGLEWVKEYYFNSCKDWLWQFKYSNSPFISDIYVFLKNNRTKLNFNFNSKNKPLKPFEQLLSIIPYEHLNELPLEYQKLVKTNEEIKKMVPKYDEIEYDYINKEKLYEIIPVLEYDVNKIKKYTAKIKLSKTEKIQNIVF